MGTTVVFIVKSAICLIVFYLFYKLLLSRDTFHRFNRIALLSTLLFSVVVPMGFISIPSTPAPEPLVIQEQSSISTQAEFIVHEMEPSPVAVTTSWWLLAVLIVYVGGIILCFLRQFWIFFRMVKLMRKCTVKPLEKHATLRIHNLEIAPFSWMKYIVISKKDLEENGKEIVTHEMAHIHNKHTWDLIVADCCIAFQWFNPAAWLLKQELQSIHEFEADDRVLKQGIDATQYQLLLIKKAVGARLYSIANSFNHSSLKKRITMMLKEKSSPWARLKYLYVLPLACISMLAFAHPSVSGMEKNTVDEVNNLLMPTSSENNAPPAVLPDKSKDKPGNDIILAAENVGQTGKKVLQTTNKAQSGKAPVKSSATPAEITVKGKVLRSSDKKPLSNVNIVERDPSTHRVFQLVVTKADGTFEIKAKSTNVLRFTCMGFKNVTNAVKPSVTICMENETLMLNETEVIGNSNESTPKEVATTSNTNQGVEQMPQYPGGEVSLMKFIRDNLHYPTSAIDRKVEGKVVCSCVIDAQGDVTEVKVQKSVDPVLDKEAMRVILNMPRWIPGKQNGKTISVTYTIPISFKLKS